MWGKASPSDQDRFGLANSFKTLEYFWENTVDSLAKTVAFPRRLVFPLLVVIGRQRIIRIITAILVCKVCDVDGLPAFTGIKVVSVPERVCLGISASGGWSGYGGIVGCSHRGTEKYQNAKKEMR
jgi:hypothetical protein